jgi:Ser-tRNA(Ala) deacylase AlaX
MIRPEHSHRYKCKRIHTGDGIFSNIANKLGSVITSDVGRKLITKTVDSVIDNGAKKAGEFIIEQITKAKPGELIKENLSRMRKPPLNQEETYILNAIDRMLSE